MKKIIVLLLCILGINLSVNAQNKAEREYEIGSACLQIEEGITYFWDYTFSRNVSAFNQFDYISYTVTYDQSKNPRPIVSNLNLLSGLPGQYTIPSSVVTIDNVHFDSQNSLMEFTVNIAYLCKAQNLQNGSATGPDMHRIYSHRFVRCVDIILPL